MTEKELLNSNFLELPLNRDDNDFPKYVEEYLSNYIERLKKVDGRFSKEINNRLPLITELANGLIESIEKYYIGKTAESYTLFKKAVDTIKPYLDIQLFNINSKDFQQEIYFKARTFQGKQLSKKDMFIRPFEHREIIPTYRYSIPGLPCLYLSSHISTAWCELDYPDINTLQISKFEIDKSFKRLYFTWNINNYRIILKTKVPNDAIDRQFLRYLTYFPLHALCSLKIKNPNSIFKPEYIFPQFLMQWIGEENIDMIEYMSTQVDYSKFNTENSFIQYKNIAIPAKKSKVNGICEILKSKIKVTEPISWQNLMSTYPTLNIPKKENNHHHDIQNMLNSVLQIELIKGKSIMYDDSIFGILENYLKNEMIADYVIE